MPSFRSSRHKSLALAVALTIFMGPVGLAYVSVAGASTLSLLALGFWLASLVTLGLLHFLTIIPYVGSIIWAIVAVERRNRAAGTGDVYMDIR
jgi:hypothetical protein